MATSDFRQIRMFSHGVGRLPSRLSPMTYIDERPGKLVQVRVDGVWHGGTLEDLAPRRRPLARLRALVGRRRHAPPGLG
jgi:hypothetical protein